MHIAGEEEKVFRRLSKVQRGQAAKSAVKVAVLAVVLWRVLLADLAGLLLATLWRPGATVGARRETGAARAAGGAGARPPSRRWMLWVYMRIRGLRRPPRHPGRAEGDRGDPHVRARFRRSACSVPPPHAGRVPAATVVITNPTHYAVALAPRPYRRAHIGGQKLSISRGSARWRRRTMCRW